MIHIGKLYRTPWEPSGLMRVTGVEPESPSSPYGECAVGYFVGDHPRGYKDGSPARYQSKELEGREVEEGKDTQC